MKKTLLISKKQPHRAGPKLLKKFIITNFLAFFGCYLSIFAGRIADAGVDPIPIMQEVKKIISNFENIELIWASPRELLNIIQADEIGCDIITVTNDLLKKIYNLGKDLTEFSLDTVKMFYNDAIESGFKF